MRIPIAFTVLFFLMGLSVLQSILSVLFSFLFGTSLVFPLIDWLFALIEWIGEFIRVGGKVIGLLIGTIFNPLEYGIQLVDEILVLLITLLELPAVIFYPIISMFGDNPLIGGATGILELISFVISVVAIAVDFFYNPEAAEEKEEAMRDLFSRGGG